MTTRILVGFDGTPEARSAARFAAQLAVERRARLLLVNVIPEPWPNSPLSEQNAARQAINEEEHSTAEAVLRAEAAELVGAETRVALGKPARALAAVAAERDVALVVVGHRDRGALARVLAGSVAIRLVQICSKPVLVLRRCDPPPTPACIPRSAVVHELQRSRARAEILLHLSLLLRRVLLAWGRAGRRRLRRLGEAEPAVSDNRSARQDDG